MIWFREYNIDELNLRGANTMVEHLGMKILELGPNFVKASMPVDHRTKQPLGLLHGGASVAFAESLASMAANLIVNPETHFCVGLEINANHISSVREGEVHGLARPLHRGKSTQVWEIHITQHTKLVCVSRMTISILPKK